MCLRLPEISALSGILSFCISSLAGWILTESTATDRIGAPGWIFVAQSLCTFLGAQNCLISYLAAPMSIDGKRDRFIRYFRHLVPGDVDSAGREVGRRYAAEW